MSGKFADVLVDCRPVLDAVRPLAVRLATVAQFIEDQAAAIDRLEQDVTRSQKRAADLDAQLERAVQLLGERSMETAGLRRLLGQLLDADAVPALHLQAVRDAIRGRR